MRKKNQPYCPPTHAEIADYAFYLWNAEGRPSGQDLKYWLEAEAHLTAIRRHDAGLLKPVDLSTPKLKSATIPHSESLHSYASSPGTP